MLSTKVLCYRALVELVFGRQARSGAVCKARSSTAQGAHETVVKGLSNIRSWTARVLVRAKEHRRGGVRGGVYTPHPTCPAGALTFNTGGLDGSAAAEERDNYHRDAYMNDRNHASGAPRPGRE